jgi:hypothetical protein
MDEDREDISVVKASAALENLDLKIFDLAFSSFNIAFIPGNDATINRLLRSSLVLY